MYCIVLRTLNFYPEMIPGLSGNETVLGTLMSPLNGLCPFSISFSK